MAPSQIFAQRKAAQSCLLVLSEFTHCHCYVRSGGCWVTKIKRFVLCKGMSITGLMEPTSRSQSNVLLPSILITSWLGSKTSSMMRHFFLRRSVSIRCPANIFTVCFINIVLITEDFFSFLIIWYVWDISQLFIYKHVFWGVLLFEVPEKVSYLIQNVQCEVWWTQIFLNQNTAPSEQGLVLSRVNPE